MSRFQPSRIPSAVHAYWSQHRVKKTIQRLRLSSRIAELCGNYMSIMSVLATCSRSHHCGFYCTRKQVSICGKVETREAQILQNALNFPNKCDGIISFPFFWISTFREVFKSFVLQTHVPHLRIITQHLHNLAVLWKSDLYLKLNLIGPLSLSYFYNYLTIGLIRSDSFTWHL